MFAEKYSKSYRREIARESAREWLPKNDFNVHTRGPFYRSMEARIKA